MDICELMESVCRGEMEKLKYLVETRDVDLNVRDSWDATPLYYACLCGHEDVVQYLVEQGARCEANTFDGERCLYAALTPAIKQILKEANLINAKTMRRDSFEEFLRQLLESRRDTADLRFDVHGESVFAHKCVLFARSGFFADKLVNKWRRKSAVRLNSPRLVSAAFKAYVQYLYTGVMDVNLEREEEIVSMLETVGATELVDQIRERVKKAENYKRLKGGKNFGQIVTVQLPETSRLLSRDLSQLAEAAMPREDESSLSSASTRGGWTDDSELPFTEERPPHAPFADVCFFVDGATFFCHKTFFFGRSDFFRALIDDHFEESDAIARSPTDDSIGVTVPRKLLVGGGESPVVASASSWGPSTASPFSTAPMSSPAPSIDCFFPTPPSPSGFAVGSPPNLDTDVALLPLIRLHSVSRRVFERIVHYVYTNQCELDADGVYELLEAADQFLLPGLKAICGVFIAECLDVDNVIEVLRTARLFTLNRLEDACYAFIAAHFERLFKSPELKRFIAEDAEEIENRDVERGDSIPIVDEIRYHISSNVQSWSEMEEASERLAFMEKLLDELNLDGCCQKKAADPVRDPDLLRELPQRDEWDMEFMLEMPQEEGFMD